MRFDFHPAATGWALSEVNSDVPGGFAEASMLPRLAAQRASGQPAGDVAGALVSAMASRVAPGDRIAFVHATAYTDDRQVMQFLASRFAEAGFEPVLIAPDHLRWPQPGMQGRAYSVAQASPGFVNAIVRFYPAEWMPALPAISGWQGFFGASTVSANPVSALLTQSKRLPLLWDRLGVPTPAWRAALPETRDPREAPWRSDEAWLVKPALGRVGEDVAWRSSSPQKDWRKLSRSVALFPRHYIAQRRFEPRALTSRDGLRHLCIGVFTVDGRAAGFYGRVSHRPIIDKHAQDIAVLVAASRKSELPDTALEKSPPPPLEHKHVA
jgi:glutathionylspermidine synthase